jgi:hypothetical protein
MRTTVELPMGHICVRKAGIALLRNNGNHSELNKFDRVNLVCKRITGDISLLSRKAPFTTIVLEFAHGSAFLFQNEGQTSGQSVCIMRPLHNVPDRSFGSNSCDAEGRLI